METERFDIITRYVRESTIRRGLLRTFLGLLGAAGFAALTGDDLSAQGKKGTNGKQDKKCPKSRRCGKKCCTGAKRCVKRRCVQKKTPTCRRGLRRCEQRCINTATDPKHCGACNKRCGTGRSCAAGQCSPYRFVTQFGGKLTSTVSMILPWALAMDGQDRVMVLAQTRTEAICCDPSLTFWRRTGNGTYERDESTPAYLADEGKGLAILSPTRFFISEYGRVRVYDLIEDSGSGTAWFTAAGSFGSAQIEGWGRGIVVHDNRVVVSDEGGLIHVYHYDGADLFTFVDTFNASQNAGYVTLTVDEDRLLTASWEDRRVSIWRWAATAYQDIGQFNPLGSFSSPYGLEGIGAGGGNVFVGIGNREATVTVWERTEDGYAYSGAFGPEGELAEQIAAASDFLVQGGRVLVADGLQGKVKEWAEVF